MKYFLFLLILSTQVCFSSNEYLSISYFETNNSNLKIQDISTKSFQKLSKSSLSKGFNFNIFWIKITPKENSKTKKILYLNNPTIDYIDFYHNLKLIKRTGDHRRNLNQHTIAYAFSIEMNSSENYYFKIQTQNGLFFKFILDDPENHRQYSDYEKMFLTFFFGFLLSLIIYNIFLFATLKERVYLYYISFQISFFILLLSYSGMGYYLIWHGNYFLNEFIYKRFEVLSLFFALLFAQTFLDIKSHSKWLNRIININLLLLLYLIFTPWEYHSLIFQPILIQTVLLGFIMIAYAMIKRVKDATLFFIATFFILLGTLLTFLKIFGFLEVNLMTTWSVFLGSMIEALLFSIALANRITALKQREQELMKLRKEELEKEVKKQTKSLQTIVQEKEVLLREINHRVKNNLQIISSFISFASMYSKEEKVLQNLNQRIHAISILYSSLYKPHSSSKVNMKVYIEHICNEIFIIYTPDIRLSFEINNIEFEFDRAITIGLIVNEIITNMIVHAFNGVEEARINLSLIQKQSYYILHIEDNGIGFDKNKNYESLGLKLIQRLTQKQLKGELLLESNSKGSSFTITFT